MNGEPQPHFPLQCVSCEALHRGGIEKAIDDGWNFAALDMKSTGVVTLAGCPQHFKDFETRVLKIMKG